MILTASQKAIQASKMADNYQMADPKLTRIEALRMAFKVQKEMDN